ncbi:unnamed protein product, partial [Mesorhabditis belari]|uniref:Uncharacterized protein n=1 Tax=Mesorhabditis belari TaxID=2138241 RepID=A0AAF3FH54_9BILA
MVTLLPMGRTFVREAQWEKPTEGQGQFAIGLTVVLPCNRFKLNGTFCTNGSFNGSFALCRYDKECDPQKHDWYYAWKSSDNKKFKYLDVSNQNGASLQGFSLDYIDVKPGT